MSIENLYNSVPNTLDTIIFDPSEINFFNEKINFFKSVHPKYINDENGYYVYGGIDEWIIVYEKIPDCENDENRSNIVSIKYAEYHTDKLKVVLIFNKYNPFLTIKSHASIPEICGLIVYDVGKILQKKDVKLRYYKSIIVPYFFNYLNSTYTGFYVNWYESGLISQKGYYFNGERQGVWKFGSIVKKSSDVTDDDFTYIEYENGNVKTQITKNINENRLVVYNSKSQQNNQNLNTFYTKNIWNTLAFAINFIDSFVPGYFSNEWKTYI